jgi:hypothetical protein
LVELDVTGVALNGLPLIVHLNGLSGNTVDVKVENGVDGQSNPVHTQVDVNGGTSRDATTIAGDADLLVVNTSRRKGR